MEQIKTEVEYDSKGILKIELEIAYDDSKKGDMEVASQVQVDNLTKDQVIAAIFGVFDSLEISSNAVSMFMLERALAQFEKKSQSKKEEDK